VVPREDSDWDFEEGHLGRQDQELGPRVQGTSLALVFTYFSCCDPFGFILLRVACPCVFVFPRAHTEVAEEAGIDQLLDPDDTVVCQDTKSIILYLSTYASLPCPIYSIGFASILFSLFSFVDFGVLFDSPRFVCVVLVLSEC
jgi:hypothetical protein